MLEILAALTIMGIVLMVAAPRMAAFRERSAVRSARQELTATIEAARAAALQRGRSARFVVRGDSARAVVDTGPVGMPAAGERTVLAPAPFAKRHAVKVTFGAPSDSLIVYDGRGFANPRIGHVARYVLTRGGTRDSVCVASFGTILPRGCEP